MNDADDSQLLRVYAEGGGEAAFAELVRRHVDLVYSAAARMVRDPHLAQDVTQGVFVALAKNARQLSDRATLAGWLHQTARNLAAHTVRTIERRRAREQEAVMMNQLPATQSEAVWEQIAPQLDDALGELSEADRDAVLLRFFEKKSASEMARVLGVSDEAAQKRVSRAVERLREFLAKRGVTAGAAGLIVAVTAHGMPAAPAGMAAAISATALLTGPAAASTIITTKIMAITVLQKSVIAAALAVSVGIGIFEAGQLRQLRMKDEKLRQQQVSLAEQIQQLQSERDHLGNRLALMDNSVWQNQSNLTELAGLRNEIIQLRQTKAGKSAGETVVVPPERKARTESGEIEMGGKLGQAVIRGEAGAMEKLLAEIKTEQINFVTESAGLSDQQRRDLSRKIYTPMNVAFKIIGDAAAKGNQPALTALAQALEIPELNGLAVSALGGLAGKGDAGALDVLIHPDKYGAVLASTISALQPAADKGNQAAIDALAAVANDPGKEGLWYMTADSLAAAAAAGNPVAINALINMSASTNQSIQRVVIQGLKGAAANQNVAAEQALRALGML